jgi:hypothetical protein
MRLFQPLKNSKPDGLRVFCCRCGSSVPFVEALADLDAESFRSFYCQICAYLESLEVPHA